MALTLAQGAQMVADPGYQARIRAAMMRAAVAVATEPQGAMSGNVWQKRRQLSGRITNGPDAYLGDFLAAVSCDPGAALTWFAPVAITSSLNVNPIVITTAASHGYVNGDVVEILEHATNTRANGVWTVTNLTATTFSIPQSGNGNGTLGMALKQVIDSDLVFTVNSVFSAIAVILTTD
jgi:hypothetical protein